MAVLDPSYANDWDVINYGEKRLRCATGTVFVGDN